MEIIKLNVGGKKFTTLKSTLLKYKNSYLADLLEKEKDKIIYDENKAVFIDRNPKYFEFIIEYLRTGFMEALPQDFHTLKRLTDEALFYKLDGLSQEMYLTFLPSVILTQDLAPISKLFKLSDFFIQKWHLVYRGTRDGFGPNQFHEKCDVLKNSLIIVKTTKNYVFGGYTNASWLTHLSSDGCNRRISLTHNASCNPSNISSEFKRDPDAFIFSLLNETDKSYIMKCLNPDKAIYSDPRCGPVFGNNDINLLDNSSYLSYEPKSKIDKTIPKIRNYTNLGENYQLPFDCDHHFLAGSINFDLIELEVFTHSLV